MFDSRLSLCLPSFTPSIASPTWGFLQHAVYHIEESSPSYFFGPQLPCVKKKGWDIYSRIVF